MTIPPTPRNRVLAGDGRTLLEIDDIESQLHSVIDEATCTELHALAEEVAALHQMAGDLSVRCFRALAAYNRALFEEGAHTNYVESACGAGRLMGALWALSGEFCAATDCPHEPGDEPAWFEAERSQARLTEKDKAERWALFEATTNTNDAAEHDPGFESADPIAALEAHLARLASPEYGPRSHRRRNYNRG